MSVKIIALDLDGTLMSPDHMTVSARNREALKKAHDKGITIAIATGRTIAIIGDVCEQVPEVDYIIYSNGASVLERKTGKNIYTNLMDWDFCEKVIDYLDEKPAFYEIYINGKSYVKPSKAEHFISDRLPKEFVDSLLGSVTPCENIKEALAGKSIEKITLYTKEQEAFDEMWEHFSKMDCINLASSINGNMEMTKFDADKGNALKGLCDTLGIKPEEAMTFGDAGNDCGMLKFAGYSFAMENGEDICKQTANYVTKSNANDGVAVAIEKYAL
jgi:hypothetical protein